MHDIVNLQTLFNNLQFNEHKLYSLFWQLLFADVHDSENVVFPTIIIWTPYSVLKTDTLRGSDKHY